MVSHAVGGVLPEATRHCTLLMMGTASPFVEVPDTRISVVGSGPATVLTVGAATAVAVKADGAEHAYCVAPLSSYVAATKHT